MKKLVTASMLLILIAAAPSFAHGTCTSINWTSVVRGLEVDIAHVEAALKTARPTDRGRPPLAAPYAAEARSARAAWRTLQLVRRDMPPVKGLTAERLDGLETRLANASLRLRLLPTGGVQTLMDDGTGGQDVCGDTPTEKKCLKLCDELNDCCIGKSDDCILLICDWECC